MRRPVAAGGDAEGESGEEEEEAGRETALKEPRRRTRRRPDTEREQRIDGVAVEHEDHGQGSGQVDEDDTLRLDTGPAAFESRSDVG